MAAARLTRFLSQASRRALAQAGFTWLPYQASRRVSAQAGFTLLEVTVSMVIFAVITIGTLGVLGASAAGGFWESFPNAFATTRLAREYTAAATYVQSVQELLAGRAAALEPGAYCLGAGCGEVAPPPLSDLPPPPASPSQLAGWRLDVVIRRWTWDPAGLGRYCPAGEAGCAAPPAGAPLTHVRSTLTWTVKGKATTLSAERFLP